MLSRQIARTRIPSTRPLRPPNAITISRPVPQTRLFTQTSPHRILTHRHTSRPQIPYLSQPPLRPTNSILGPNPHLARLLSTETRRYISEQFYLAVKWSIIIWVFGILGGMMYLGIAIELQERKNPTPEEWSFWARWALRGARAQMEAGETQGFVDWASVGGSLRRCLARLEDRGRDGKGTGEVEEGGILIEGVRKAGQDISGKSWPWRSGYCEVIMGCAAAAEQMDGMVLDETRGLVFPKEMVVGPSNLDPRPVPAYMPAAPLEENCVRPFEAPETFYMRVLTGKGFTTKQKLDAALVYANWLEFKGLQDSAEEMYRWGVDIAKAGLPNHIAPDTIIDARTSVLLGNVGESNATPNLLQAATALAIHHARTSNVSSALPLFLSVLRARRSAPLSPMSQSTTRNLSALFTDPEQPKTDIGAASSLLAKIFQVPAYPLPPPSGDLPLIRTSEKPSCDESELMLYIGEILFATSPASNEGLGWTRQAVAIAEANLQNQTHNSAAETPKEKERCKACLLTGVGNWETMLHRLAETQDSTSYREGGRNAGWSEWRGWFGRDGGVKGGVLDLAAGGVIEEELKRVEGLKERIVREDIGREMGRGKGKGGSGGMGVWIGG
ncbi:hypothetical protein LTR78_009439 [Recurvomyces mirabilis]|uniref:MFS maltose permease n=1 Tax=Recurvomyces mirabilis TaxID=574656 RepID=A0AAE0WHF1_9PEZI|nr:hypothetical protein LTR78_009439 [Recurvomyces mirabilis]KAK5154275.1 hypothetical protein LTS14_006960 [Recurvomyces mirabilis]